MTARFERTRPGAPTAIAVGVPARDEGERIGRCLHALDVAAAAVDVPVHVVVCADRCRDSTAVEVAAHRRVAMASLSLVTCAHGRVGVARDRACRAAIDRAAGPSSPGPSGAVGTWLATTDADSVVAEGWLAAQLLHAARGLDGVAGLVDLDPADTDPGQRRRFRASLVADGTGDDHGHVHGASLGVDAGWYRAVGGFPHLAAHEDVSLWARLRLAGARLRGVADVRVTTSGRLVGRAPVGFSTYLGSLSAS